jgi:hypothetical protein
VAETTNQNTQTTTGVGGKQPPTSPTQNEKAKRVEVICEGPLGFKLLRKGDVTGDEEYVALLKTARGRKLVKEVK